MEDANLEMGVLVAEWATREGIPVISPHANSREFTHGSEWAKCLGLDVTCLARCDFILALPGWEKSTGCFVEVEFARRHRIPVFYTLAEVLCFVQSTSPKVPLKEKL